MFAKIRDLTRNILSSEKNLPLKDSKETKNRKEDVDLVVRNFELNATCFFFKCDILAIALLEIKFSPSFP